MTKPAHTNAKDLVLKTLSSSEQFGLSASQVTAAREKFGWNELTTVAPETAWKKFFGQFSDVVVWILIAAAFISGAMGEWTDTAAIVTIVLLNALLGFYQEGKAEKSLAALQSLAAPKAKVVRDEKLASIAARELVPGDLVEIEAGDILSFLENAFRDQHPNTVPEIRKLVIEATLKRVRPMLMSTATKGHQSDAHLPHSRARLGCNVTNGHPQCGRHGCATHYVPGRAVHLLPGEGMAILPRQFRPFKRRNGAIEPRRIAARVRSNRIQDE